jgi:hypothetical protein
MNSILNSSYKGIDIRISTSQAGAAWSAHAVYARQGGDEVHVEPPEEAYASEDEARRAALQAAAESIDRARAHIGKP